MMILTMDKAIWYNDIFRNFFGAIDYIIYSLIGWIFEGIFNLSNLMYDPQLIEVIYKRVYLILGIFMIFKLSFSFLQYIVSPDKMVDKEQGAGKIVARVVTMIAMLIAVPILFFSPINNKQTALNMLQSGVLKTLPKIILGLTEEQASGQITNSDGTTASFGNQMAVNMLLNFYYPVECKNNPSKCSTSSVMESTNDITTLDDFQQSVTDSGAGNTEYDYQYMWPLTTIAGIAMSVILIGIALDIAKRTFKLVVLQMVAPIPIMSYIDPKSSKDGAFASWVKTFFSTYIDIFVKIGVLYLLVFLSSKTLTPNGGLFGDGFKQMGDASFSAKCFMRVFLTIGLFFFAKEAPKFLKDALGIKDSGGGGLFGGLKQLGTAAGVLGGVGIGMASRAAGAGMAAKARGAGVGGILAAGLGGALTGGARGLHQGYKGAENGNPFAGMRNAASQIGQLNQRQLAAAAAGSTAFGRFRARVEDAFGIPDPDKAKIEDAQNLNAAASDIKSIRDFAKEKGYNTPGMRVATAKQYTDISGHTTGKVGGRVGDASFFKSLFDNAVRNGDNSLTFRGTTYSMNTAREIMKDFDESVTNQWLTDYDARVASDPSAAISTIENSKASYTEHMNNVSASNRGGFTTELSSASSATDTHFKDLGRHGADVAKSVDREGMATREANRAFVKNNNK